MALKALASLKSDCKDSLIILNKKLTSHYFFQKQDKFGIFLAGARHQR